MNKQREEFENRFPDITYLELKDDKYVPRTNMTKYGDAVWAIVESNQPTVNSDLR